MRSALVLALGIHLAAVPALFAQSQPATANQPTKPGQSAATNKVSAAPAKPASNAPAKAAAVNANAKPASAAPAKSTAQPQAPATKSTGPTKAPMAGNSKTNAPAPAAKPAAAPQRAPASKPAKTVKAPKAPKKPVETQAQATPEAEAKVARRDPFESLVARQEAQKRTADALPPGIHGLQVSTLRLDGIVKSHNGMIAVVSNPQARTYFLREGDQLYDGTVDKIAMDGVSFHEIGKDAFGKPVERQVSKRIYSSAGEQQ